MDLEFLNELKKRVIIAMFSDDDLMEHLVLKGGNLLDIVYGISTRPSKDVDFSIPGKFPDLEVLRTKVEGQPRPGESGAQRAKPGCGHDQVARPVRAPDENLLRL